MNKNSKLFYIVVVTLLLVAAVANAEEKTVYKGQVKIVPNELAQHGDSLYVSLDIDLSGAVMQRNKTMDIIPVLSNGIQSVDLPKVSLKGKEKYKEYRRQMALMSQKQQAAYQAPYAVGKGYGKSSGKVSYFYILPFESWMKTAYLNAKTDLCGCGTGARQIAMERLVDNVCLEQRIIIEPYDIQPYLAYIQPKVEELKIRDREDELHLDFAVNKTEIRPEFGNNQAELDRIQSLINEVRNDLGVTVSDIDIIGFASPEGTLAHNQKLSENRAKALQTYLQQHCAVPSRLYHVHFGGENWEGLVKALETDPMPHKQQVLQLIDSYSIEEGREKKIMELSGGEPYRYMLKNIFPSLRYVSCRIHYNVKNFDVEDAKEIIKKRPQNLSLLEMYKVANTYQPGSQEFNDVFDTAVRMFPEDQTALLNAAAAALSRKDVTLAQRYLDKVVVRMRIPEYDNTWGVLEMLNGHLDTAEKYLKAAQSAGVQQAGQNLEELAKKRANIAEIEKQKYE